MYNTYTCVLFVTAFVKNVDSVLYIDDVDNVYISLQGHIPICTRGITNLAPMHN